MEVKPASNTNEDMFFNLDDDGGIILSALRTPAVTSSMLSLPITIGKSKSFPLT